MKEKVKQGLRFVWFFELVLFLAGFYIVYRYFDVNDYQRPARSSQPEMQNSTPVAEETILERAEICIDIDEEQYKPLLPKKTFNKFIDYLYCFTEISGKIPDVIIHYWFYEDEMIAQKKVNMNVDPPVGWSRMSMSSERAGSWRVEIRTQNDVFLGSTNFILR